MFEKIKEVIQNIKNYEDPDDVRMKQRIENVKVKYSKEKQSEEKLNNAIAKLPDDYPPFSI